MFKNLTDSQKGWLMITTFIVEVIAISGVVSYCNKSIKVDNEKIKMKWLMEMDEFYQLMDMIKD